MTKESPRLKDALVMTRIWKSKELALPPAVGSVTGVNGRSVTSL